MNRTLVVFDLDFTLWNCGGTFCDHTQPPYSFNDGKILDAFRAEMKLYPDTIYVLEELYHAGIKMAIASRTHASEWADELLEKFRIRPYFKHIEMFPGSKINHFKNLHRKTGIPYNQMFFFDDEQRNIEEVSALGVNAFLVKDGIRYEEIMTCIHGCEAA